VDEFDEDDAAYEGDIAQPIMPMPTRSSAFPFKIHTDDRTAARINYGSRTQLAADPVSALLCRWRSVMRHLSFKSQEYPRLS
jgi:hypothetical protein